MAKYEKIPVVIDAWVTSALMTAEKIDQRAIPTQIKEACEKGIITFYDDHAIIKTLEGDHKSNLDDMIICGVKGELYPCKPDIFEMTYRKAQD